MNLSLVGLVLVVLAVLVVVALAVRHRRQSVSAVAARPRTVADLVRMRTETAPASRPAEPPVPSPVRPPVRPPVTSLAPSPVPRSAPAAAARPEAPQRRRAPAAAAAPVTLPAPRTRPASAPAEPGPRPPGPDIVGYDTPWHRAAVIAAGHGGTGTWEPQAPLPPAPVVAVPVVVAPDAAAPAASNAVPVPLRLVPPVSDDGPDPDPEPQPDPGWTGWADWADVDAEVGAETGVEVGAGSTLPVPLPIPHPSSEAEPVALPLGRRTPAERAAEQAAADVALLRTFGDPHTRPDNAPVVSMVRPDVENIGSEEKGADQPVRFRVVRRDGSVVAGATVTLLDNRGNEVATATVGADGRGEALAPGPGGFVLVSTAAGYQPGVTAVTVADAAADAEVLLARSASVSGAVRGEDGPIADARVTLVQDGETVEAVSTDADGRYRITEIGSGEYELAVAAPGWVPVAEHVDVPDEAGLRHDVTLAPASPIATSYDETDHDGMMTGPR